ncbi:hypothetical protein PAPYR_11982 [Paratrimastix pyriformis]|uniref:Uncharacterized protein n=1 Tax=Paratrimastix pyriformis TaxID=342808 RepID=A0ABQ8U2Q7_9EUKA|nr:hypothetical protein PAPYR_11982 [Paratrimastix pyriformis]
MTINPTETWACLHRRWLYLDMFLSQWGLIFRDGPVCSSCPGMSWHTICVALLRASRCASCLDWVLTHRDICLMRLGAGLSGPHCGDISGRAGVFVMPFECVLTHQDSCLPA